VSIVEPGTASLSWSSEPARIYRVQFKNDLNEVSWTDLPGDVTASGSTSTKLDSSLGANMQRFYRVLFVQ
jgi:hypothetical protein